MTKEELLGFINGDGKETFNEITAELGLSKIDKTAVENFFKTDEGKSLLFSKYDTEHARRMKKYKEEGGFAKDFDAEMQKRNPQMTEEQKKLMEMETKLKEYERKERVQTNYKNLSSMNEDFRLPKKIFEMLVGEDENLSKSLIEEIGNEFKQHTTSLIESELTKKLGESGKPLPGGVPPRTITMEQYERMSKQERMNIPLEEVTKLIGGK